MGWQVGSACYPTEVAANTAAASAELGRIVVLGSNAYSIDIGTVTATTVQYRFRGIGGPADINIVKGVTPVPCGLIEWGDSLTLAWAIVAAWAGAYGIKFLARTFNRGYASDGLGNDA